MISGDTRLEELGISAVRTGMQCRRLGSGEKAPEKHRRQSRLKWASYTPDGLTESGGVVLFRRRAWAFIQQLPESSLFILRNSTILPACSATRRKIASKAQAGERMPSCINNIISGPSSMVDIELIKVVGVHGPVKAVYLIMRIVERDMKLDINRERHTRLKDSVKDNLT
ncbi:LUD domain-containing protein [Escherichia coli]